MQEYHAEFFSLKNALEMIQEVSRNPMCLSVLLIMVEGKYIVSVKMNS